MKQKIRKGVFETNSSSEHSVTVYFDKYASFGEYGGDVWFDDYDIKQILTYLPAEMLLDEIKRRINKMKKDEDED